ncbi:MAG: transcriptional regulator [Micavibrio aeruginosavorus]|uniref:Transcriptional regulator n=1 Tax=Micavibrio aeruginosavorus TaxID=349221 RepID=A0A2W5C159_9BACT|nr:MAG: transcriptional regulator [Micavibrio aeruginosavorus]
MATPERHKTPEQNKDCDALLDALALAMVKKPKASLGELAKAVGISRGTLYNFCRTRDELLDRLFSYGIRIISEDIEAAKMDTTPPLEALRNMTLESFKHWEITLFMTRYWKPEHECPPPDLDWDAKMDALFLRGQREGVFRIDIPAAALSEIWVGLFVGLVDAEYRDRIARSGIADLMERAFLQGMAPVKEKVFA